MANSWLGNLVKKQKAPLTILTLLSLPLVAASAKDHKAYVNTEAKRVSTAPLKQMGKAVPAINLANKSKLINTNKTLPGDGSDYIVPNKTLPILVLKKRSASEKTKPTIDTARQLKKPSKQIPTTIVNFDGMDNVTGAVPPDTNGDVGPNHYVQVVNTAVAVWDKQGNQILEPTTLNSLWTGLGGLCESTNRGDPIVLYDAAADRWLISQFAFDTAHSDNRQCIAISQTPDPTGAYYAYDFEFSDVNFNDYPKFGIWRNGYYMSVNQFQDDTFAGVAVVAYERDAMLTGSNAQQVKLDLANDYPNLFSILPADIDGQQLPPENEAIYFFAMQDDWFHGSEQDQVQIFQFHLNWAEPQQASFELAQSLTVSPNDLNIETSEIIQPNGITLDSLRGFAQYRLAYRNFGDYAALVVNHNVDANSAGQAGLRWYQINIDNANGDITLADQGTFAPDDGIDRWMGSVALDALGNMAIGYNAVSESLHPSIYYASRLAGDPKGQLTQGEGVLIEGGGSQGSVQGNRWADYSSMSVDPSDDCTFWYTNEYYQAENQDTLAWSTRIGAFKFDNCTSEPTGTISGQVTDASSGEAVANIRVTAGGVSTITDSQGNYSLRLASNRYSVSFAGYWYETVNLQNVNVEADEVTNNDIALTPAATTSVSGVISDGSGKGWPIYSQLTFHIPNAADINVYTDPFTGEYSLELVSSIAVPITIESQVNGYTTKQTDITPQNDNGSFVQNYNILVDELSCSAPGYISQGIYQGFENGINNGWMSVDENDSGVSWTTTAFNRSNVTGGTGEAALIDSDANSTVTIDTSLISPEIIVADLNSNILTYLANFQTANEGDSFDLDISLDDQRWENILNWTQDHGEFFGDGEQVTVDLTSYIQNATQFRLRWHYYNALDEWFAQVDDVALSHQCLPVDGGTLVAGLTRDANTDDSLNDVLVSTQNNTVSFSNDDPNLTAAIYFGYVNGEKPSLLAQKSGYDDLEVEIEVVENTLQRYDLSLLAPLFSLSETSLSMSMPEGLKRNMIIDVENTGQAVGSYYWLEINNDLQSSSALSNLPQFGQFESGLRYSGPKSLLKTNAKHIRDYRPPHVAKQAAASLVQSVDLKQTVFTFAAAIDKSNDSIWASSLSTQGLGGNDSLHQFLNDGTPTDQLIDASNIINSTDGWFGDFAYNARTQTFWVTEIDNENCIHQIDPNELNLTGEKLCPQSIAVAQHGLAYDPVTDTYFTGSWSDGVIHRFNAQGEMISSISTGLAIAGLAYHPASNRLYVSVSASAPEFDIVTLDASDYSVIEGMNVENEEGIDVMPDDAQGGLDIDCDGNLWMVEQTSVAVFEIDIAEGNACEWSDITWLNAGVGSQVEPNETINHAVEFDSESLALGSYSAQIIFENSSPYGNTTVPVTLNIVEEQRGNIEFEATQLEVEEEQVIQITLVRTDGADFAASVDYATQNGSAIAGEDYTQAEGTITWQDNDSSAKTIAVEIGTINQHKDFSISINNPQNGVVLGNNTRVDISIIDKPKGSGSIQWWAILIIFITTISTINKRKRIQNNK